MRVLSESGASDLDPVVLARRVAEAAGWCEATARGEDPQRSLRRLPDPLRQTLGALQAAPAHVVHELVRSRERHPAAPPVAGGPLPGKLLAYFPDADLADGAAADATSGFFDIHNTPPWDTWIALIDDPDGEHSERQFLIAYIPQLLIPLADRGVDVNPEQCIRWLSDETRSRLGI